MHRFVRRSSICLAAAGLMLSSWQSALADDAAAAKGIKSYVETIPGTQAKFTMVPIAGGTFKMGSPDSEKDRGDAEGPQVQVDIDPFFMEEHEVTWGEYTEFLKNYHRLSTQRNDPVPADKMADAVTYPTPLYELEAGPILDAMGRGPEYPAVIMSQFAARQYCKWLSKKTGRFYRLPTEAEWEYAARAGTTTAYNFGDDAEQVGDHGWYFDNSPTDARPDGAYRAVKQKKPNAWGLYDMHGNVGEWCLDQYDADWFKKLAEKGGHVKEADAIRWPDSPTQYPRVIRGGGWSSEAKELRSASRIGSEKNMNQKDPQLPKSPYWMTEGFWVGFRVVSPLNTPPKSEWTKYWDADDASTRDTITRDRDRHEVIEEVQPAALATPK